MSGFGGAFCVFARFIGLGAGCLALANCSSGSKVDSKYGVSASERVVAAGEPVPKGGGVYRVGRPYTVAGRVYIPEEDVNYSATGIASWYGDDFHGRFTSNGEIYDMNSISAAHKTLPLPSYVRVTNLANKRSIVVRVNDRGPFAQDRVIDLSYKTAHLLGFHGRGLAKVKVDYVGRAPLAGSDDRKLLATLREGDRPATMLAQNDTAPARQSASRSATPPDDDAEEAPAPVKVASAHDFTPTFFDSRSMTEVAAKSRVEAPAERRLGEGAREVAPPMGTKTLAKAGLRVPTTEFAARPQPAVTAEAIAPAEPAVSPVSAYAPTRYDQAPGFMSGRGLY
jgi:rare lipoprotein A